MPVSYTPDDDEAVALGDKQLATELTSGLLHLGDLTATDNAPGGVVVYPHGYSARFKLVCSTSDAANALRRLGWSQKPLASRWKKSHRKKRTRYEIRTCAWLVHRPPLKSSHLGRCNTKWRTKLYGISIEHGADGYFIDVAGVRASDVESLFENVMRLGPGQYELMYLRAAERYIVLAPSDAHRVMEHLERRPVAGRGRLHRKSFLVRSYELEPVKIRTRASARPMLEMYRIQCGATFVYRLEARLQGATEVRGQFTERDIELLDRCLLDLVAACDLAPQLKPARWEPQTPAAMSGRSRDEELSRLPMKAYRGRRLKPAEVRALYECHTMEGIVLVANGHDDDAFPPAGRVRTNILSDQSFEDTPYERHGGEPTQTASVKTTVRDEASGELASARQIEVAEAAVPVRCSLNSVEMAAPEAAPDLHARSFLPEAARPWARLAGGPREATLYRRQGVSVALPESSRPSPVGRAGGPAKALADEIAQLRGALVEVVLDAEQPPTPFIDAIVEAAGAHRVGVGALAAASPDGQVDAWRSVVERTWRHPFFASDLNLLVLVVDASVSSGATHPYETFDERRGAFVRGKFDDPGHSKFDGDATHELALPVGGALYEMMSELRECCEHGDLVVVVFTIDMRRPTAYGELCDSHFYSDARVRSHIGDAGRYWCHQRYRVEQVRGRKMADVVTLKDEVEGRTGRQVYRSPRWCG